MNTGDKNVHGRTIWRGPRGGEYVCNPDGKKVRVFKRPPARVAEAVATRAVSPSKHKGFTKTKYMFNRTKGVYVKNVSGRYYHELPDGKLKMLTLNKTVSNSTNGTIKTLRNHVKKIVPAPAPVNREGKMPTPSPRRVISTAERNIMLAAIKARLNRIRSDRRAHLPKNQENIKSRLRLAARRVRARRGIVTATSRYTRTRISIPIYRTSTSVPRRKGAMRSIPLNVYENGPLLDTGAIVAMKSSDFDLDWFKRQNTYISKLNDYDYWTVQAHTNRSHYWIGPYTRDGSILSFTTFNDVGHMTPLWPQIRKLIMRGEVDDTSFSPRWVVEFKAATEHHQYRMFSRVFKDTSRELKKRALDMYKIDLKRIIAHAPKSRRKMILYRGSNFDIFRGTKGHWHTLNSFCSAAFNVEHALIYGRRSFQRITVLPGTSVLLVAGVNQWSTVGEYEIMVNIDTKYLIRSRNVTRQAYHTGGLRGTVRVTDITITK